jgi:hypothetical protein
VFVVQTQTAVWLSGLVANSKLARQMLSEYHAAVTPMIGMHLISAHIINRFWKLQSFRLLARGMDIDCEDETSYTTEYPEAFLKNVEDEYCAKHRRFTIQSFILQSIRFVT